VDDLKNKIFISLSQDKVNEARTALEQLKSQLYLDFEKNVKNKDKTGLDFDLYRNIMKAVRLEMEIFKENELIFRVFYGVIYL
jgi:hypothetical protein